MAKKRKLLREQLCLHCHGPNIGETARPRNAGTCPLCKDERDKLIGQHKRDCESDRDKWNVAPLFEKGRAVAPSHQFVTQEGAHILWPRLRGWCASVGVSRASVGVSPPSEPASVLIRNVSEELMEKEREGDAACSIAQTPSNSS